VGKGGRCIGLTTLPLSCADRLEIWESQPPGTLRACPGLYRDCFTCGWINLHVRCRVLLESTGFVPCFAAGLGWYHFAQRIRCCSQLFISFAWHRFNFTQRTVPKFPNIWLGTVTNTFI